MSKICGADIGLELDITEEHDHPLAFAMLHEYGGTFITLEEFAANQLVGLDSITRQRYAAAFEIMARQLRVA